MTPAAHLQAQADPAATGTIEFAVAHGRMTGTIKYGDAQAQFDGLHELERLVAEMGGAGGHRVALHLVERSPEDRIRDLGQRELEVALAVCRGATNRQIAGSLFYSVKSVEARLTRIYRTLGISGRCELLALSELIQSRARTPPASLDR